MSGKAVTHLIADTHFGHEGIIGMCQRPFANVREMDEAMITNWNAVVHKDDTVIHVGDFAHRASADRVWKIFQQLNGIKHLVPGNHDGPETKDLPWASVRDMALVSLESTRLVLCHYALRTWPGIRKGASCSTATRTAVWPATAGHGYRCRRARIAPARLSTIRQRLAQLPPLVDPEGGDDFENDGVTP